MQLRLMGVDVAQISDGFHTFDELYHHRAILTAVLFSSYPDLAWKTKRNSEGEEDSEWFLVGVKTPTKRAGNVPLPHQVLGLF